MEQFNLNEYRAVKEQLARWLQSAAALPVAAESRIGDDQNALTVQGLLRGLSGKIAADTFKVAVVGEYSSGKSSLLNVLLRLHKADGRKSDGLLPTAITPTTAVITTLVYDEAQQIEMTLDDGRKLPVSAEQINGFLTEPTLRRKKYWWLSNAEENERIAEHITQVRIGCLSPLLGEGVELVDTPGIGSINEDHARITKQFTAEVDAALFLVSVDPPMGEREMTFLQHIKSITDRCLFVQTKRDLGERTEHGEKVWQRRETEHRRRIEEVLNRRDYPFYCVSAYQAANGLRHGDDQEFTDSGFAALETELQRFLVAERGVPRLESWLKRSRDTFQPLKTTLEVKKQQLEDRLADIAFQVANEDDYAQWLLVRKPLEQTLAANAREAAEKLANKKTAFTDEVMREALRELSLTTPKQLAENPDRRLQMERAVVRSIQYHSEDLLLPILDFYLTEAQKTLKEALGENLPKAFQQFSNMEFNPLASRLDISVGDLVETHSYTKETRRGGFGIVDFFLGTIKTEVTEHNLDKSRFNALVEKAIEETYRETKSELIRELKEFGKAVKIEMDRIIKAAKDAVEQNALIQKQDKTECQAQMQENERQLRRISEMQDELEHIAIELGRIRGTLPPETMP